MRSKVIAFTLLLLLPACNMNVGTDDLPTPGADGNIYVTATSELPTPNAEGVIVVTATPDTLAVAQSVPTIVQQVPTQQPISTSTVPPAPLVDADTLLADAEQLVRNGYYEEAVAAYQGIIAQAGLSNEVQAEAAFLLGQAAGREGLFSTAVDALTVLIDRFPDDERTPQAYFLRGDAYLGVSQWQLAIADFQQYLALRPQLVDSYAYERIGDAQLALGQTEPALASYQQAVEANRSLVPLLILREKLAQILSSVGQVDAAVAQYDAILAVARNAGYRASIELAAANVLLAAGRQAEALTRAQRIFNSFTETASAYPAMQILLDNGSTIDGWRRGQVAFNRGEYLTAIEAFNEYTSSFQLDAIPADLYLLLGRSYREIGNSDAALVAFQTLIDQYPGDPLFGEALLERGRTRFLAGDYPAAIETYLAVARDYAALTETAAEAMWRAGYLYGTQLEEFAQSRQTFVELADRYPTSEWALSGLQIAASVAVANGNNSVAEGLYGRLATITAGEDQAAAYYWAGRLARQRGDVLGSDQAFDLARQAAPGNFFSARSEDIVLGREAFQSPAQLQFTFDEVAERQAAEAWLRETFAIAQDGDLSALSPELRTDPRMVRGQELWVVGATDEALEEFDALLDEARETANVVRSYQLAHYLRDIGAYQPSIVAGADIIVASGQATLDVPPYIARFRYPAYYIDLIQPQAERYGFDPLLMLGLMRQESLFNPTAVSIANAMGLTQVIPSTAQYIAGQLNWPLFQDSDLFKPYVGVAFGAYYLDEQLRLFDGNRAAALAAYNAGPGFTLDWVRLSGGDVDTLVTTITFAETRTYIQRIYSHYTIYRSLYGVG